MKTIFLALLSLTPALALADTSYCEIVPNPANHITISYHFDFYQSGRKVATYNSLDESISAMNNLVSQGVCEKAAAIAPSCTLSSSGNTIFVNQGSLDKDKTYPTGGFQNMDQALAHLAKLEKNGLCQRTEVPDSVCTIGPAGDNHQWVVHQDDNSRRSGAVFTSANEAIHWRAGLAEGLGCKAPAQALECKIQVRKIIFGKVAYDVYLGTYSVTYYDRDQALAARDGLLQAKACIQAKAASQSEAAPAAGERSAEGNEGNSLRAD